MVVLVHYITIANFHVVNSVPMAMVRIYLFKFTRKLSRHYPTVLFINAQVGITPSRVILAVYTLFKLSLVIYETAGSSCWSCFVYYN